MELFVLSPYFDAESVVQQMRLTANSCVMVSSSLLLPSERAQFSTIAPGLAVHTLSETFTDAELARLDADITADIDSIAREADAPDIVNLIYPEVFMDSVMRRRNRVAAQRIRSRHGPAKTLWICPGPNIAVASWATTFPEAVVREIRQASFAAPEFPRISHMASPSAPPARATYATSFPSAFARTRLFPASELSTFLDLGRLSRSTRPRKLVRAARLCRVLPALWRLRRAQTRLRKAISRSSRDLDLRALQRICAPNALRSVTSELETLILARRCGIRALIATLHAFAPPQALAARILGLPTIVVQDGYLPINYPLAVYGVYRGARFVWWSEASRQWGARLGLEGVVCSPQFAAPAQPFSSTAATGTPVRVLALLNHGGEWTSLIFRTDIDHFVAGIVAAARLRPEVAFRIRTHPTAVLDVHDGRNALERLKRFVAESGVTNVSFSTGQLEADIDWATFALSEYSLTLLEFAMRNCGGIATFNPTGRRNFFEEFTARGVPHATDVTELVALIDRRPTEGGTAIRAMFESAPGIVADALRQLSDEDPRAVGR